MVNIQTVDLALRGITLPNDRVGMVIAQPFVSLTPHEPYVCAAPAKAEQMAALSNTLAVARAPVHGAPITHFTVFPEYSIPGVDGITLIDAALHDPSWPSGSIVIGGTDGMSKADFALLTGQPNTFFDAQYNALNTIGSNQWINCGVTWVKGANGTVERWLQPKLHPAWPEQNINCQDMFRGQSVFMFKGPLTNGTLFRFSTLVCFDWIATVGTQKAWRWVTQELQKQATQAQAELSLSWFFVIQNNRRPSDHTFLNEVGSFFDQTAFPTVRRERACLVFANTAGRNVPGRASFFGSTSLVFTRQTLFADPTCSPTFSNGGERFRSSPLLSAYRDVLFRENGACIHSFALVNPDSLNAGAAGRTIALERAFVFPLNGTVDPRTPGTAVPACVKWLNDELDAVPSLAGLYPNVALSGAAGTAHQQSVEALRSISAQSTTHAVALAACQSSARHADEWSARESEAVEHLVHTLAILGVGFPQPVVGADPAHAAIGMNGRKVDLLAIRGSTHEACINHSKTFVSRPRRQVLLISRDCDNTPWRRKFGSFLETEPSQLGQERRFVDPQAGTMHLGYEKLLQIYRDSPTPAAAKEAIYAELAA